MKIKFLLITFFALFISFSINAQEKKSPKEVRELLKSDSRPVSLTLNNGEEIVIAKQSMQPIDVSASKQAEHRKSFDCPDIFAKPEVEKEPAPEVVQPTIDPKPEIKQPTKAPFFLPDPVFFRINKSVIDASEWAKIELAVNYLREHPTATVVATGYADKKTGNQTINLRLSKERSNAVAKAMEEKYGIEAHRITVNWKGDGLQPFQLDNDKNRAVLFLINP
ncbi:OmpA family protein [Dysgonomonas sp. Marseille-P4361]|uniref:OmpA family protein n=1 Tax=Dysgonomonas sp. Marseille-P4361 TaxID=2161820 RepID=UPI000D554F18|nr:OmpA family protein [Dysgonomonas sp. Marseille-P4361]